MSARNVMAVILGGGQGSRLAPLTSQRAKPAVPIGGKYRLIDIPISNCLHSGIRRIYVLTQFLSASLHRHIYQTYKFDHLSDGFCHVLAAQQTATGMDWYQGTADAVRKQLDRFTGFRVDDVVILSGDHLYRMDYARFVEQHRDNRADVSIGVLPVDAEAAPRLGILKTDREDRVLTFSEKPAPADLPALRSLDGEQKPYLASMGIYVFRREALREVLEGNADDDFGRQVIPKAIDTLRVYSYPFSGYWEDIGTIRSFFEANLALTERKPRFDFYDADRPIYTRPRFLPSSRADGCQLNRTALAEGCRIEQAEIEHASVGLRSIIEPGSIIRNSLLMGADFYETDEELAYNQRTGRPAVGIGAACRIDGAIIDKNARIGSGVIVHPRPTDAPDEDHEAYAIRDGIVVIKKNAIVLPGTEI